MNAERKDYLRRLIAGVRKGIAEDRETIEAVTEFGEGVTVLKWLDVSLLCYVVEQEVLKETAALEQPNHEPKES